jgi:hypothetical protein
VIGTDIFAVTDRTVSQWRLEHYRTVITIYQKLVRFIPAEMATPSPDDRFHHCTYSQLGPLANEFDRWLIWGSTPKTRCFFAPMNSSWQDAGPTKLTKSLKRSFDHLVGAQEDRGGKRDADLFGGP